MSGLFGKLIDPIAEVVGKVVPDTDTARKLAHDIATMADKNDHAARLAQLEINKAEAASASVFKGGWRPYIGWVCGAALTLSFLVFPLVSYVMSLVVFFFGVDTSGMPQPPELDWGTLGPLMLGMLGLGTTRMIEKIKGVASK